MATQARNTRKPSKAANWLTELWAICKDVASGALPLAELPAFVVYLLKGEDHD